jgi:hypothetical protein
LFAGSLVKVRNSVFLGNGAYGVLVSGADVASGDDTSTLDLGKAGDPGMNWLQTAARARWGRTPRRALRGPRELHDGPAA